LKTKDEILAELSLLDKEIDSLYLKIKGDEFDEEQLEAAQEEMQYMCEKINDLITLLEQFNE
jgi:hypothetical protein